MLSVVLPLLFLSPPHASAQEGTEPPEHWPVDVSPNADGTYTLGPTNGDVLPPAWVAAQSFHGGAGVLRSPSASSSLGAQGSSSYGAGNLSDDDHKTAWVEGVSGGGVGEWVQFTFGPTDPAQSCGEFTIVNGYQKSEKSFTENGRVKSFDLFVGEEKRGTLHLMDEAGEQLFRLPVQFGDTVRLVITEIYPGTKYEDTAITEMWLRCSS